MKKISEYGGNMFNHLEGLYRPGEKELAMELAGALGLTAIEIKFAEGSNPLISIHPNDADRDSTNNVMFLAQMSPAHVELENLLEQSIASNPALSDAMNAYKEKARTRPGGIPHFGIRYPSAKVLDPVVDKLRNGLSPALRERVTVTEMPPYKAMPGLPDIKQVFVYSDVFVAGPATHGQLIELQIERGT